MISLRRTIILETMTDSYPVHASADNRFILYVNGQRVGEGLPAVTGSIGVLRRSTSSPFFIQARRLSPPACGTSATFRP